jgi:hypothetical protein
MTLDRAEDSPIATTLTMDVDHFGGLKLEDFPVHESVLEKKKNAALAQGAPRKSPQKVTEDFVPLECILKPHVSILEQRKSDQSLLSKYQTVKEISISGGIPNPHEDTDQ